MSQTLDIRKVGAHVFRCPLETPVITSFGTMRDRPMVLVRVEDKDGAAGWGEVWCNFPAVGAEHRARLVDSVAAPLLTARPFAGPAEAFDELTRQTAVLAIQSGEPGPFAQVIAGLDIALWDLAARKASEPVWRHLARDGTPRIAVYASGLNPDAPEKLAAARQSEGYTAFKLKVGFGAGRDVANLKALRATLGPGARLMVDANQGWTKEAALEMLPQLEPFGLSWLEEPLRADRPWSEWRALRSRTQIPLAAGENIAGHDGFDAALAASVLGVVQPDLAKWGGFSGCLPVTRRIRAAGARFCPHYLGGGIGLLASAHLLAAAGGGGLLEIDANPNPLRTLLWGPLGRIEDGAAALSDAAGLGVTPDLDALRDFAVGH
ncbi:MAG: mandelate racemase/muconate lactonizing enzyme family protein [Hyphomicrobiaceae bacterium]|nr:MAG: mandelate racemase/muconate lactonizing enzyme family protein [Hyphomicrobiaceae bacterium]